ncbi:hypothetical protein E5288_WYG000345 [Bos mutus]|uniref:C-type natriuretic peptide n=1 Tax=Bos mutus TaxID=72004 RepID=A0A6B0QP36_9CETA|nr:PREDICTED: C-type natriuretic peptide [Bos mutus]MXQ79369.1 hypothetical protein [Bos mutus]
MRSPDHRVVSPARGKGEEGKGLPEGADHGGLEAGGRRAELPGTCDGRSQDSAPDHRRPRRVPRAAAARAFTYPSFPLEVPRTPSGEEVAEPQAAGGGQKKGDKTPGGGGANLKDDRSRLLRDLRVDTKSRAAWTRLLHEHPNARKYKGGNKKGLSKGCFGLKLDRIGSMSGLGC